MAATADRDEGLNLPKSTGAVKYEGPEETREQPVPDGESTGAVKPDKTNLGEVKNPADEHGGKPAGKIEFPTPKEPTTMTSSWLSDAEAKVITQEHQQAAKSSVRDKAEPKKSDKAETPAPAKPVTKAPAKAKDK